MQNQEYKKPSKAGSGGDKIILYSRNKKDVYAKDREAKYVKSQGGELNAQLSGHEVTIIGGFFGYNSGERGSLNTTIADIIMTHNQSFPHQPLTVHLIKDSIYHYHKEAQVVGPNFKNLLLDFHNAHYDPFTSIGPGVLPEHTKGQTTLWPPEDTSGPLEYLARYRKNKFAGRHNSVTIHNYKFLFFHEGTHQQKYSLGQGEQIVQFKAWRDLEQFRRNAFSCTQKLISQ